MELRKPVVIILLVLILALQVFLRLPFIQMPLERDEGAYGYMAQRILAGEVVYRDGFDHKPPVVYFIYAGLIKAFGNTIEAIRIPTLIYSLLTTLSLFYLGLLLFGGTGGLIGALFYAVFSGGPLIQGNTSNTETFMVLPLILAVAFFLKKKMFWAGLLSGLAIMIKPVAGANFLVLLLFLILLDWRALGRMLLGSVIPFLFFVVYFLFKGALFDFVYQVFLVNGRYLRSLPFGFFARLAYGGVTTWIFAQLENSLIWFLGLIGLIYVLVKERTRELFLLSAWTLASAVAVVSSGLFFGHYYIQLIPGLCLLSAFAVIEVIKKSTLFGKIALVLVATLLFLAVLPYQLPYYFKYSPDEVSVHQYGKNNYVLSRKLAQIMKKKLRPDETILVWSANPEVYFYLEKKAPTRYFNYLKWMETQETRQEIVAAILAAKPNYIVWTGYAFAYPELVELVENEYQPYMGLGKWLVYQRKK